ncbi:MAG: hypothetical protein ABI534_05455 [Chloroflexota bacterium]|jgi:hypothetical protein
MSRKSPRKSGRPYQPYPTRRTNWTARIIIMAVIAFLILSAVAVAVGR